MKKSTDILELTVISLAEGKNVGKVKEVVIDTEKRSLAGFLIQAGDWYRINGLPYSSVQSIGNDAIIIENSGTVIDASATDKMDELLANHSPVRNYMIYTKTGKSVGTVKEIVFDPENGRLLGLEIETLEKTSSEIPIDKVLTFGQNILIIDTDEDVDKGKKKVEHVESKKAKEAKKEEKEDSEQLKALQTEKESEPEPEPEPDLELGAGLLETEPALDSKPDEASRTEEVVVASTDTVTSAIEEPALEVETSPEVPESEDKNDKRQKSSISDMFASRQAQLLIGKKLIRDITTDKGETIAAEGDIVSEEIIKNAIDNKKLVQLMVSVQGKDQ